MATSTIVNHNSFSSARSSVSVLEYATNTAPIGISFYSTTSGAADNPNTTGSFFFLIAKIDNTNVSLLTIPFSSYTMYANRRNSSGWQGWKSVTLS